MQNQLEEWLLIINEDFKAASALLNENLFLTSIYHSHQATEKTLKYLLIKNNEELKKTHNLVQLVEISLRGYT